MNFCTCEHNCIFQRENTTMVMKNSFAREPIIFWEGQRPQVKHRRRYGIIPQGFLFCGLGKINIDRPQLLSLQVSVCMNTNTTLIKQFAPIIQVEQRSHNELEKNQEIC